MRPNSLEGFIPLKLIHLNPCKKIDETPNKITEMYRLSAPISKNINVANTIAAVENNTEAHLLLGFIITVMFHPLNYRRTPRLTLHQQGDASYVQ